MKTWLRFWLAIGPFGYITCALINIICAEGNRDVVSIACGASMMLTQGVGLIALGVAWKSGRRSEVGKKEIVALSTHYSFLAVMLIALVPPVMMAASMAIASWAFTCIAVGLWSANAPHGSRSPSC
jgi:hypothetical protein